MSSAPRSHPLPPAVHGSVTCGPLCGLFPSKQLASSQSAGVSLLHAYGNLMMSVLRCILIMEMASLYFAIFYIILFEIRQFTTVLFYASLTLYRKKQRKKFKLECAICVFFLLLFFFYLNMIFSIYSTFMDP